MKKKYIQDKIREVIDKVLMENEPKPSPARPQREPQVVPKEPGTRPKRRRTLTPPKTAPDTKPKASEKDLLKKIEDRYKTLK